MIGSVLKETGRQDGNKRGKVRIKQSTWSELFKKGCLLLIQCISVPIIYIQLVVLGSGMRLLSWNEIIEPKILHVWKEIAVNLILAAGMTLSMASFAPSLTFFNHFLGIGIYVLFAAAFMTKKDSWSELVECHEKMRDVADLVEIKPCQNIIMPAYLYVIAGLCVAFALIELITLQIYNFSVANCACCGTERRADLQVLKLNAQRELAYQLQQMREQEGDYRDVRERTLNLTDPKLLTYNKQDNKFSYTPETLAQLHNELKLYQSPRATVNNDQTMTNGEEESKEMNMSFFKADESVQPGISDHRSNRSHESQGNYSVQF